MNEPNDPLHRLLSDWRANHRPAPEDRERLRREILKKIQDGDDDRAAPMPVAPGFFGTWNARSLGTAAAIGGAVAVAVVWMVLAWFPFGTPPHGGSPSPETAQDNRASSNPAAEPPGLETENPPGDETLSGLEELRQRLVLFERLSEIFPNQLAWVEECQDDIQLQVVDEEDLPDSRATPLAVRISLETRQAADRPFEPAGTTYLMTRNEQLVSTGGTGCMRGEQTLWVYSLDEKTVAYDLSFEFGDGVPGEYTVEGIQTIGDEKQVLAFRRAGNDYRISMAVVFSE